MFLTHGLALALTRLGGGPRRSGLRRLAGGVVRCGAAATLVLICHGTYAYAQEVERVVDGDTIVVQGVGSVRLIGIDAPESTDKRKLPHYFATRATEFLRQMIDGRPVRLAFERVRNDRYGRTVAYVFLLDGTFVNEEMILRGYAHVYTVFPFKYLERFRAAEQTARRANQGFWADGGRLVEPTAPLPPQELGRCEALTQQGARCRRKAKPGEHYCWQHLR